MTVYSKVSVPFGSQLFHVKNWNRKISSCITLVLIWFVIEVTFVCYFSVPPTSITLDYDGVTYNDGSSISVVAGDGRQFTCKTPGVYPQTTFTWTLPSGITTDQPLGTTTSSTNTDDTVDSSNTIDVNIAENPATSQLKCGATNRPDGSTQPDISITVTLQIKGVQYLLFIHTSSHMHVNKVFCTKY